MTNLQEKYGEQFKEELSKRQAGDSQEIEKDEIPKICEVIVRVLESKIQEELTVKKDTISNHFLVYIEFVRDATGMWTINVRKDANTVAEVETYTSKMCYSTITQMINKIKEELKKIGVKMQPPKEFKNETYCYFNFQS